MVFKKFSSTLTRSSSSWLMLTRFAFWSSGQHTGHEFCGDALHVEFFCQNCLAWSKADAYVFSNLSDSQTAILENQMTNCIDVNVVCWRGRSSTSGIFINWRSSCFETTVPLKTLCSAHTFTSEGLLKHFPHFSSSFPEFEAKFHPHTHTRCSSKSFIFTT